MILQSSFALNENAEIIDKVQWMLVIWTAVDVRAVGKARNALTRITYHAGTTFCSELGFRH